MYYWQFFLSTRVQLYMATDVSQRYLSFTSQFKAFTIKGIQQEIPVLASDFPPGPQTNSAAHRFLIQPGTNVPRQALYHLMRF